MRRFTTSVLIVFFYTLLFSYSNAFCEDLPKKFSFDEKNALDEWEEKIFRNKVLYTVIPEQGKGLLSAQSQDACSGLIYKVKFDPKDLPMISWQWKVLQFPDKTDINKHPKKKSVKTEEEQINNFASKDPEGEKNTDTADQKGWIEKDDYAARVYVIFPSFIFTDTKCIEYIWAQNIPKGSIITSPYFKNIKLIVAESGTGNKGKWIHEEQNIYEDYINAFGKPPTRKVGAISLMTDTDNTLSTAEAFYKQIKVGYANEQPKP